MNVDELHIQGIELETKYKPSDKLYFVWSFSYQENENGDGLKNYSLAPNYIAKIGVGYSNNYLTVGLFDSYQSKFHSYTLYYPELTSLVNPESESFHNISINVSTSLKNISKHVPNLIAEFYIKNLLDQEQYIPRFPIQLNTQPVAGGRSIYFKLRLDF